MFSEIKPTLATYKKIYCVKNLPAVWKDPGEPFDATGVKVKRFMGGFPIN